MAEEEKTEEEGKKEEEGKTVIVPGGTYVAYGPTFEGNSYMRHTKTAEKLRWARGESNEGAYWLGGAGDGWVPSKLGKKKDEPREYYSGPGSLIRTRDEELEWKQARKREANKGGPSGEAAERMLDLHEKAKKGE